MIRCIRAAFIVVMMTAVDARADVITFDGDAPGPRGNGFKSTNSSLLAFSSTAGNMSVVAATGECLDAPCFVVMGLNQTLFLDADGPLTSLSLLFGNDLGVAGYFGELTAFRLGVQVGQVTVLANNNDLVDQVIAFSVPGVTFDRVAFRLTSGFAPLIDTISFTAVPEPGVLVLLGVGLSAIVAHRASRRMGSS
jgi:hypothetical protein